MNIAVDETWEGAREPGSPGAQGNGRDYYWKPLPEHWWTQAESENLVNCIVREIAIRPELILLRVLGSQ
jgi:hypothetical protein